MKRLTQFIPTRLPITEEGLTKLMDDVIYLSDLPDTSDTRATVATCIMHLGPTTDYKSKRFFIKSIRKALINKIAFEKIKSLQAEEIKAQKELQDAKSAGVQETSCTVVS